MSKTVIVYGPQGCGKTLNAEKLRKYFGCTSVVELDAPTTTQRAAGRVLKADALHLTNEDPATLRAIGYRVDGVKVFSYAEASRFVGNLLRPERMHRPKVEA